MNAAWMWPVLPSVPLLPWSVAGAWGVLMAALVWRWGRTRSAPQGWRVVAVLVGFSAVLPWTNAWTAMLALALQTPSLSLLVWALHRAARSPRRALWQATEPAGWALPLAGALLGWALWLDTLNLWPPAWALYAWGFGAPALWAVAVCVALVHLSQPSPANRAQVGGVVIVLLVFALCRWPSGNLWDALLDPFVWVGCHAALWRAWRDRVRGA